VRGNLAEVQPKACPNVDWQSTSNNDDLRQVGTVAWPASALVGRYSKDNLRRTVGQGIHAQPVQNELASSPQLT
jgi:hypothetical protein